MEAIAQSSTDRGVMYQSKAGGNQAKSDHVDRETRRAATEPCFVEPGKSDQRLFMPFRQTSHLVTQSNHWL